VAGIPLVISLYTRYEQNGFTSPRPTRLFAEIEGEAESLREAITTFLDSANTLLVPAFAVVTNAFMPPFELEVAYGNTAGATEHEFLQSLDGIVARPEIGVLRQRLAPVQTVWAAIEKLLASSEGERVHRACVQYQEALGAWESGGELRAVMHLWMAVEALTKARLRQELQSTGLDEEGLCGLWNIEKPQLDGEVRVRLIFQGDADCYRQARKTSDGLEHMFKSFRELHGSARACRDATAAHVREAILTSLELPAEVVEQLTGEPFAKPVELRKLQHIMGGTITGPPLIEDLHAHPHLRGTSVIGDVVANEDGTYQYTFTSEGYKVWAPDGIRLILFTFGGSEPVENLNVEHKRGTEST
jgi:hypothetical protein